MSDPSEMWPFHLRVLDITRRNKTFINSQADTGLPLASFRAFQLQAEVLINHIFPIYDLSRDKVSLQFNAHGNGYSTCQANPFTFTSNAFSVFDPNAFSCLHFQIHTRNHCLSEDLLLSVYFIAFTA